MPYNNLLTNYTHDWHYQLNRITTLPMFSLLVVTASILGTGKALAVPSAPHADVQEIMTKELADFPGKEGLMLTVTYPPGWSDEIHRHDAHAFLYVLEGTIVMQVEGGTEVTLKPGESFYEGPNDIHIVGRNASATQPAKFVVVLIKNKGAPPVIPVK